MRLPRWWWPTVAGVAASGLVAAAITVPAVRSAVDAGADAVAGWGSRLRDLAASLPETETEERSLSGESVSLLVVVGEGESAAFALVTIGPGGPPAITVLPQDLLVSVPGFGEYRLGQAMVFEGPDLVALAVTNELGIRIDRTAALASGAFAAAFGTEVDVDLAVPFFVGDGAAVERRLPEGPSRVAPGLLEELLVTPGAGDAFEWIQRQGAVWRSVLGAVAAEPGLADRLLGVAGGDAPDLLVTVAGSDDALVATLPVALADDGGARSALVTVGERIDGFVAERFAHLVLRPEGRPRVEILNGNGRIGSTRVVAGIVVRAGYRVIRTDNADTFDYEDTLVIAQGKEDEATGRDIVGLLGHGLLFLEVRAPSGTVDVSIIVGSDVPTGEG